jgi:hypothetical protein
MARPSYYEVENSFVNKLSYPAKEFKYRAYKDGVCKIFDSRDEALLYSKLFEKFQINVEEYSELLEAYNKQQQLIYDTWFSQVTEYFSDYSDGERALMWDYAYDRGHASGYDEVFSYMIGFSYYIDKCRTLYQK